MRRLPLRSQSGAGGERPAGGASTRRLFPLVAPVIAAGAATLGIAAWTFGDASGGAAAGVGLMLAAAVLAEAYPVPIESLPAGHVSLAAVFVVATGLIYGWAPAAIVALVTRVALEIVQRRPLVRLAYNGAVYALCGAAAGLAERLVPDRTATAALMGAVVLGAGAFWVSNVVLTGAVVSRWSGEPLRAVVGGMAYWTAIPFAIMASVSVMLYILWERSPFTVAVLVGPLVAIVLYQRSVYRSLAAMRLALTDPLTGLGNRRHFHERLEADLDRAESEEIPIALCLIDIDDFKRVNDAHGHEAGDDVLVAIAGQLRSSGEAFRLGGDEFAIILTGHDELAALGITRSVVSRLAAVDHSAGGQVTLSAGVASFPEPVTERGELQRVADRALYRAKEGGKNVVRFSGDATVRALPARAAG